MSVYFISARDLDMVKIGWANNPIWRLKTLQTACPLPLTLEGAIPGGVGKEGELHRKFARARVRGEWFKFTPELRREVKRSSRPDKFSRVAVQAWLNKLDALTEAQEPVKEFSEQRVRELERRVQEELDRKARRAALSPLQRMEADGDIHFPFCAHKAALAAAARQSGDRRAPSEGPQSGGAEGAVTPNQSHINISNPTETGE